MRESRSTFFSIIPNILQRLKPCHCRISSRFILYFIHRFLIHNATKVTWKTNMEFQYKFILSIDGTVAAYRFPFLLAGDSVIFKSFSNYYEHFYIDLKEGLHYFHFNDSTLIEQIKWARIHDHNKVTLSIMQLLLI